MNTPWANLPAVAFYFAIVLTAGYTLLCTLTPPLRRHWAELIGLSWAMGAGAVAWLLFVISLAGHLPSRGGLIASAVLATAGLVGVGLKKRWQLPSLPSKWGGVDAITVLGGFALLGILGSVGNILAHASWGGLGDIDAFGIWMFKAKIVSLVPLKPLPTVLTSPNFSYSHQDYPLLFPFAVSGLYSALGSIDELTARAILLPNDLAAVAIVYGMVRRGHPRLWALPITAVFAAAPVLVQNAGLMVAEMPLIMMYTAAVSMLLHWFETGKPGDAAVVCVFAAFAAMTKNEGLAFMAIVAALMVIVRLARREKFNASSQWFALLPGAALVLPWLVYRSFLPHTHEDYGGKLINLQGILSNLVRLKQILPFMLEQQFTFQNAGLIWFVLGMSVAIDWRRLFNPVHRLLMALLLLQLVSIAAVFVVTPWRLDDLLPMVTPKLLTQATPTAIALIALNLRPPAPRVPPKP